MLTERSHWVLQLAPTWALTILLAGLLTAITWKLMIRGLHTWSQESESLRQLAEARAAPAQDELEQPLLASQEGPTEEQGSRGVGCITCVSKRSPCLAASMGCLVAATWCLLGDQEHLMPSPMTSWSRPCWPACRGF